MTPTALKALTALLLVASAVASAPAAVAQTNTPGAAVLQQMHDESDQRVLVEREAADLLVVHPAGHGTPLLGRLLGAQVVELQRVLERRVDQLQGLAEGRQVDGRNAYMPSTAADIDDAAVGLPQVAYSYGQNPTNGDFHLTETDPLVECSDQAFPPSAASCPRFVPTGVLDTRTIQQTEDGRLVTITDSYSSEDGEPHGLDTLNQQDLRFCTSALGAVCDQPLEFRFPGETGYSTHALGDVEDVLAT